MLTPTLEQWEIEMECIAKITRRLLEERIIQFTGYHPDFHTPISPVQFLSYSVFTAKVFYAACDSHIWLTKEHIKQILKDCFFKCQTIVTDPTHRRNITVCILYWQRFNFCYVCSFDRRYARWNWQCFHCSEYMNWSALSCMAL